MSREHFDEGNATKFVLAAFFSFAIVFCFLMFMMNWHGEYKPVNHNDHASAVMEEHR